MDAWSRKHASALIGMLQLAQKNWGPGFKFISNFILNYEKAKNINKMIPRYEPLTAPKWN
jgi:hypothetical protein